MNCKNCNIELYNFNENGTNSSRYPTKMQNGDIWCQECADIYFTFNPLPPPDEKEKAERAEALKHFKVIEPERPKSASPSPKTIKNEVEWPCVKCKIRTRGNSCENCRTPSPLFGKRKK